jgi:NAD(P)-dependent dehydrogenase (short-subunit alcohol dehydrogenase family)
MRGFDKCHEFFEAFTALPPRPFARKDSAVNGSLKDKTVLVVGRGSGLARAITAAALDAGARVVAAGRRPEALSAAYADEPGVSTEIVDLLDEASIAALAERLGPVDHVISTASAISPGVVDTGAWDGLGEQGKAGYFAGISTRNPAGRIGTPEDIVQAVMFALTNTFLTGQTLHIDGGQPLT